MRITADEASPATEPFATLVPATGITRRRANEPALANSLARFAKAAVAVVGLGVAIRIITAWSPVVAVALVGSGAVVASGYGLWANGRIHGRAWRVGWVALCLGLLGIVLEAVVQSLGARAAPSDSTALIGLSIGGGVLAAVGLVVLIRQRMPVRAVEALAEATIAASALGLLTVALALVPSHGWDPPRDLPLLAVPLVDFVALWLAVSLISLTPNHPVGYHYLIAALGCLLVASTATFALTVSGRSSSVPIYAVFLWGACLWAGALLHPSHRAAFDAVPTRSNRPSTSHVALILACTFIVPAVLLVRLLGSGTVHQTGLAIAAVVLPLGVVLYLFYKVFAHAAAEYRAQHDPLTGICNRTLFEDRVRTCLSVAEHSGTAVAVMYLDLDRFKSINDSLGHAVGNQVLQAVVKRLQGCLRVGDTFARVGGDEFTFLLPELTDKEVCASFAERALGVFAEPISIGGRQLTVQVSAGIALYPEDGEDAETLLKNADTAMYQAKRAGRNTYAVYDSTMSARAKLRFALETSLRTVVEADRLAVHYQPKFKAATGEMSGAEALARWQHPKLGFIPPWAFIPLAEESTLVETLGEWVLETVCRQAAHWSAEGLLHFPVAVNMSARQFAQPSLVDAIQDVLDRTGFDPSLLELEVTESVLVEHMDDVTDTLRTLRAKGIRCSIDDFGTGYSALTYLADFPVNAIKIDRSFVSRVETDSNVGAIVGAVIALAHSLGLEVVAEGVETTGQLRFLQDHACDHVQGFLFSTAVPADEFAVMARSDARVGAGVDFDDHRANVAALSILPEGQLNEVLDTMVQVRGRSELLDLQAIDSIIAALQSDGLLTSKELRAFESVPARFALGALAGLTSLTGLSAAGVISPSVPGLALHALETGTGIAASAQQAPPPETASTISSGALENAGGPGIAPIEGTPAGGGGANALGIGSSEPPVGGTGGPSGYSGGGPGGAPGGAAGPGGGSAAGSGGSAAGSGGSAAGSGGSLGGSGGAPAGGGGSTGGPAGSTGSGGGSTGGGQGAASALLDQLYATVQGVGPGLSLANQVRAVQRNVAAGNFSQALSALNDFIAEVKGQQGKKVPSDVAAKLIAEAQGVQAALP